MSYYFRISVIKYMYIFWYFVTADGFQNGCQELGSKYNMNWMLAWKSFRWQIKFQYRRTIAMTNFDTFRSSHQDLHLKFYVVHVVFFLRAVGQLIWRHFRSSKMYIKDCYFGLRLRFSIKKLILKFCLCLLSVSPVYKRK